VIHERFWSLLHGLFSALGQACLSRYTRLSAARLEREALPDGSRVRLVCKCPHRVDGSHDGVWTTSYTPRRTKVLDDPDDYRLVREGDGATTYAHREALEVVSAANTPGKD